MALDIRRMTQDEAREHASRAASLVYSTGEQIFDMLLGSRERAIEILTVMVPLKDSWCGYNLITAAFDGDDLVGLEVGYDAPTKDSQNANSPAFNVLSNMLTAREMDHLVSLQPYMSYLMHEHTPEGAYYILNLASDPAHRGKGIGKTLLQQAFNRGRDAGLSRVQLDVFNNKPAVPFYLSQGMEACAENFVPKFRDGYGVPPFIRMVKWLS